MITTLAIPFVLFALACLGVLYLVLTDDGRQ